MGCRYIHIGLPTSEIHLKHSIEKSRAWVIEQACTLIDYAKQRGAFVSISAEDVGRSDLSFVVDYASRIHEAGADRLRLSDTVGILTPDRYHHVIKTVASAVPVDIQCHAHNDLGYAVSNTVSGLQAGAKYFHVTVNGIGERAGMPDLAQTVMSLKIHYGIDLGIKLEKLNALAELVSQATGTQLYPWQPVTGRNVFAHESGIHAKGTLNDGAAFEPFSPSVLGQQRTIVIGKHSGRASLRYVLDEMKLGHSDEILTKLLSWTRECSVTQIAFSW